MILPLLPLPLCGSASAADGALAADLARVLTLHADIDVITGKRKVEGTRAATRVGATATERWSNERFRQVMLLVLEFRLQWPNGSLLTDDDVEAIRTAIDNALYEATRNGHVGDIYDLNPTTWAIWMVQRAHVLKFGGWTVESAEAQQRLSFETLYRWLEGRHSLRERRTLIDEATGQVAHRYVLPFKKMNVPPSSETMFKLRKGGRRLSDWLEAGSGGDASQGLPFGIYALKPAEIVAAPPGAAERQARATAAWNRVRSAAAARGRGAAPLRSVDGETDDGQETRQVIDAVMHASSGVGPQGQSGSAPPGSTSRADGGGASTSRGGGGEAADDPNQGGAGLTLEEIERSMMEGSDTEGDDGAQGGGAQGSTGERQQSDGLSDFELQRRENIRRNEQRLRELGLLEDPLIPQRRPPVPRQPRQPRNADGPRRQSSRLQRAPKPLYDESASSNTRFDEQARATIKTALLASELHGADLEVVHFMSATQLPRDKIVPTGVRGDAEALDSRPDAHNILVSLKIRDFLRRAGLAYSPVSLWKWIALLPGLDVTALLFKGEVVGACIGFYSPAHDVYLTHMTATHRDLQGGTGIGRFLRRQQLRQLEQRRSPDLAPLEVVSLSANSTDGDNGGAVAFQRHVFTQKLGYEEVPGALPIIQRMAAENPELELDRVMRQDVTPLRFRQSAPTTD